MQTLVEAEPTETELELVHSTETTVRVLTGNAEAEYKAGDSDPPLRAELLGPTGPVDLSGATVTISLHSFGEVVVDAAPVEVLDGPAGRVEYDWETVGADLALEGLFDAEFRVETADDDHLSFPNTGYLPVRISADV